MQCYLCGNDFKELRERLCDSCYAKEFQLIEVAKKLEMFVCKNCGGMKLNNKMREKNIDDFIKENIKIKGKDVKVSIENSPNPHIYAVGFVDDVKREEKYHLNIEERKILCDRCVKLKSGYYESKLQLRGNIPKNVLEFTEKQMKNIRNENAFYRVQKVKDGLDIFLGSKSVAKKIAAQMKRQLKAELKRSYKLHTRREGKDIYRDSISVRFT